MHRHASVNRVYRLVWNGAANSWVPAAETTRGRGKGSSKALLATALSLVAGLTEAAPLGGKVVSGSGHIGQDGAVTTITQTTPVLSLAWTSFNIAAQETVDFVQPSASAIAINRITGGNGTQILGHLNANGQVYLINPNGIVFGRGAQVDVGGLVASTLDINDANLGADARTFSGTGAGAVLNQGTINATGDGSGGGYIALLGNHVGNQGTISARLGTVALGAGSAATLTFSGNSLVHLQVDRSVLNSVAENGGLIRADGGQVLMSAGAKDALLASVVNNTGVIEARTVEDRGGTITLLGGMAAGTVNVAGTLDASAPDGGNGGFIETSAAHVEVADAARITTAAPAGLYGSWLIDPQDFVVAASGGDITGATLSANLANTSEKLQSSAGAAAGSGDINVNDAVSWSANTTLTLEASNNVNVNASLTATGNTAGVVIRANTVNGNEAASGPGIFTLNNGASINLPGTNPSLSIAGTSYIVINNLGAAADATTAPSTPSLQGMAATANLSRNYALGSNIDATATETWNAGAGFTPIGSSANNFNAVFDGLGHTITNLFINLPTSNNVGLIGYASNSATIRYVGLVGANVSGQSEVGALVGYSNGSIHDSYAAGVAVNGAGSNIGGLVGESFGSRAPIDNSYATGTVTGGSNVGGLVGDLNYYGAVTYSFAAVTVTGTGGSVGGLVGSMDGFSGNSIANSYATGPVSGASNVGGLVGNISTFYGSSISNSYATGNVSIGNGSNVGGLVGTIDTRFGSSISDSYATGTVRIANGGNAGGLVGDVRGGGYGGTTINNSFATGDVTIASGYSAGGLVGAMESRSFGSTISNSYATGNVSITGGSNAGGLVGYVAGGGGGGYGGGYGGGAWQIINSHASGTVSASGVNVGGLVGTSGDYGSITNSYATGPVSGNSTVGGLVGNNVSDGGISTSYATGQVSGNSMVGGLVGYSGAPISTSYSTGQVTGSSQVGGLLGAIGGGSVTYSYWNTTTSGQAMSAQSNGSRYSATGGLTTLQMQTASNFVGFTFSTTPGAPGNSWVMVDIDGGLNNAAGFVAGVSTPSVPGATFPMLTSEYSTVITNAHQLQLMTLAPGGSYTLAANIDAAATARAAANGSSDVWSTAGGYFPMGTGGGAAFSGTFDGLNHTISNLTMNWPTIGGVGLFGNVQAGASIRNLGLVGASVTGSSYVGGLAARNYGSISNSYVTGAISGSGSYIGGLVGGNYGAITNSYFTGSVAGSDHVGGLAGSSYGTINNSYAAGDLISADASYTGGLVGIGNGTTTHGFSNVTINGVHGAGTDAANGDTSLSTAGMMTSANFSGAAWSIDTNGGGTAVWRIYEGYTAPLLSSFLTPLTVSASNASHVFNGVAFAGNGVTYSATPDANLLGTLNYGPAQDAARAGNYAITPSGLYSNQQGYSITAISATLTISPLALTGTLAAGSSVYGSPLTPGAVAFSNLVTGYTAVTSPVTVSSAGNLSGGGLLKVGSYTGAEAAGSALTGVDAGNYTFAGGSGNYSVTPLALTGTIATGNSTYSAALTPGAVTFSNAIMGDAVAAAGTVTVTTAGHLSSSGNFTAGTHPGSETIGSAITGADAGNYTFAGASGNYTVGAIALTGSIATGTSIYGSALTPGAVSLSTPILGDAVAAGPVAVNTAGHTSTSGNLTAGTHAGSESVGSALIGADAGNYTFIGATGDYTVTALALTGSIATGTSIYGSALTPGTATFTNAIANDVVGVTAVSVDTTGLTSSSGHLAAGTHTGVEAANALSGADAENYTFAGANGNYIVTPLTLSIVATGVNKVYDGTTAAAPMLSGAAVLLGDHVSIADSAAIFATKNVGSDQVVSVGGITITGADAADYSLANTSATTTAAISAASLTVNGLTANNKVYDGTVAATLVGGSLAGVMAGDAGQVTLQDAGSFASKNVGTGISVTAAETLSGVAAGNYVLMQPTGLTASITPAILTYEATIASRTAGQPLTGFSGSVSGFVAGETLSKDTAGTLQWQTSADAGSRAGSYAIDGGGLTAANYVFVQASGNATALTLQPATVPPPGPVAVTLPAVALSAIAGLQAMMLESPAEGPGSFDRAEGGAPCALGSAWVDGNCGHDVNSKDSSSGAVPVADTERSIGATGGSLTIVNGGVRIAL